ncbi:OmpA family protein [Moheibacter sediminis]|uniref:Outer membrane protein OmpA n=1 Tax=Moheibacter sediminis TaxID=1434700 RepID=A0A1W2CI41_9FLAO|nr:OmpA family protein [Moheibacter sediminis]SMC84298.1 Outer membrane protein OmpA [Moheibacter sediminis]
MSLNFKILSIAFASSLFIVSCKCDKGTTYNNPIPVESDNDSMDVETETEISKIDVDGNYIYEIGNLFDLSLPNGTKLNVGENSSENKFFKQLGDSTFSVSSDKTQGWITLDRVYFASGKSDLTGSSDEQIKNIVKILKAFPTATIKVGGYTDNTGGSDVNMKVSGERAKTVADQIIAEGIEASRLESEGYGAQHFVCPANDTKECQAQNRRVDIRITKK